MFRLIGKKTVLLMTLALGSVAVFSLPAIDARADGSRWNKQHVEHKTVTKRKKTVEYYKVTKTHRREVRKKKKYHKVTKIHHRKVHKKKKYYSHNRQGRNGWVYEKKVTYYKVREPRYGYPRHRRNTHHGWHKRHHHKTVRTHQYYERRYEQPVKTGGFSIDGVTGGRIIGALLGGAAGTQFGKGRGRTVAIIGGAIIGAVIGGEVGRSMQDSDQQQANTVLETAPTGQTITWNNPDTGRRYNMTPTRTYRTSDNLPCRDYTSWVFIDGFEEQVKGRACRMPDGRWKMLS